VCLTLNRCLSVCVWISTLSILEPSTYQHANLYIGRGIVKKKADEQTVMVGSCKNMNGGLTDYTEVRSDAVLRETG
jgi:hypothetical protein